MNKSNLKINNMEKFWGMILGIVFFIAVAVLYFLTFIVIIAAVIGIGYLIYWIVVKYPEWEKERQEEREEYRKKHGKYEENWFKKQTADIRNKPGFKERDIYVFWIGFIVIMVILIGVPLLVFYWFMSLVYPY